MDEPPPGYDEDLESSFERRHAEELDMLREWEDSFPKIPGDSDQWPPEVTPGRHGNCLQPQRLLDENPLPQELISKKKRMRKNLQRSDVSREEGDSRSLSTEEWTLPDSPSLVIDDPLAMEDMETQLPEGTVLYDPQNISTALFSQTETVCNTSQEKEHELSSTVVEYPPSQEDTQEPAKGDLQDIDTDMGDYSVKQSDWSNNGVSVSAEALLTRGRVYRVIPPGPHLPITGSDGTRVYLKMRPQHKSVAAPARSTKALIKKHSLLSIPFRRLREEVEEEARQRLLEDSQATTDTYHQSEEVLSSDSEPLEVGEGEGDHKNEQTLWVDKYTPRQFTDLLSDDGINRTLLSWLKLWDEVVFGLSAVRGDKTTSRPQPTRGRVMKGKKPFFEYFDPKAFNTSDALDGTKRPKLKVALLCGPPGLGKTTLAHVIAVHAGYNVIEMNASDDRSPEAFKLRISSATQMQAVLNINTKPNCLIIDEIDGAPVASINILIDLIKRKDPSPEGKKNSKEPLTRPIICICNDQYVPSLRELRQHALVLIFPVTEQSRLAQRLHEVCKKEHLRTNLTALSTLCEKAYNDIRSCLNTLQFLQRRHKEITISLIRTTSIGQKDAQKSLFALWKDIFQLPSGKKQSLIFGKGKEGTRSDRFVYILSCVSAIGEYDKVSQGVFENFPNVKYRDPHMRVSSALLDWLVFQNVAGQFILQHQNYTMMSYLPFASVAAHMLMASPSNPYIHYPHKQHEVLQSTQRTQTVIDVLMNEMPPQTRNFVTRTSLVTEVLPLVVETLTPTLRPVNVQLYSAKEKQLLSDLVDIMISYNLSYQQERTIEGSYEYVMQPNVDLVVRFPSLPQRRQLTYSAKQLVSREVEMERMRRSEKILYKHSSSATESTSLSDHKSVDDDKPVNLEASSTSDSILLDPSKTRKRKAAVDFFTRLSGNNPKKKRENSRASRGSHATRHPLWFRYNQGFSNAVRRPIRIQDLL